MLADEHTAPHAPQFVALVFVFVSHPLLLFASQSLNPVAHTGAQAPALHEVVPFVLVHAVPQAPQLEALVAVLVSQPSSAVGAAGFVQLPYPDVHVEVHTPPEHALVATLVAAQARPHAPQLFASVPVATSHPLLATPSQFAYPALQDATPHTPALHEGVPFAAAQAVLPAQFPLASHVCGVRFPVPAHCLVPGTHAPVHAPLAHTY